MCAGLGERRNGSSNPFSNKMHLTAKVIGTHFQMLNR